MPRRLKKNKKKAKAKHKKVRQRLSMRRRPTRGQSKNIRNCFAFGRWSKKKLFGKRGSIRSPCVRVDNYTFQLDGGMYPFQAAWCQENGAVPKGMRILHDCTMPLRSRSKRTRKARYGRRNKKQRPDISSCINVKHMRLGDAKRNKSQEKCQQLLARYSQQNESNEQLADTVFVEDLKGDHECKHGLHSAKHAEGCCFMNNHLIAEVDSLVSF